MEKKIKINKPIRIRKSDFLLMTGGFIGFISADQKQLKEFSWSSFRRRTGWPLMRTTHNNRTNRRLS